MIMFFVSWVAEIFVIVNAVNISSRHIINITGEIMLTCMCDLRNLYSMNSSNLIKFGQLIITFT